MSNIIYGILTSRGGGTSTTWGLGMAASISQMGHKVAILDLDMEGGSILANLGLNTEETNRSLNNLLGGGEITLMNLTKQMVGVPGYPNLRILPGLRGGRFGPELRRPLLQLEGAIKELPDDYVFLDFGHPLSHANLTSPHSVLEAINVICDKVYVVIKDDPAFIVNAIDVLRQVSFVSANGVICEYHKGRTQSEIRQAFTKHTEIKLIGGWEWDDKKAHQLSGQAKPWPMHDLPKKCGLIV